MRKKLYALLFSIATFGSVAAQTPAVQTQDTYCGHELTMRRLSTENPELFAELRRQAEIAIQAVKLNPNQKAPKALLTIPVAFHIIHENGLENITDDQCIEQVKQLNEDFQALNPTFADVIPEFADIKADVGLRFALAKKDPDGNSTSGITRDYVAGGSTQYNGFEGPMRSTYGWPNTQYLNIYVVRQADYGSAANPTQNGSGWASPRTGTTCSYWAVGRTRTAAPTHYGLVTHELGHYFALGHTFDGGCGGTGTGGDGIADTPPTNGGHNSPNGPCDLAYSPCGELTNVQNYMDYSPCQIMFTEDQKTAIRNYTNNNYASLTSASNLNAVGITGEPVSAQFWSDYIHIPLGNPVKFTSTSDAETGTVDTYEWEFPGGTPSTHSGATPPEVVYAASGTYSAKLTVTNTNGDTDVENKVDYITIHDDIIIRDGDFKVTDGKFWDPGFDGDYGVRTNQTITLRPKTDGESVQVVFNSFEMEGNCANDWLTIYDGESTSATEIGTYCGTDNPGTIISSDASGALTFTFNSNVGKRYAGWDADYSTINLIPIAPIADFKTSITNVCPSEGVTFSDRSSGIPTTWEWEFEGGTPSTFSGKTPPEVIYSTPGLYQVKLTVTNDLGSNAKTEIDHISVGQGAPLDYAEGFENGFPPSGWKIDNPDAGITWEVRTDVGNNSASCLVLNNADYSQKGQKDGAILKALDFSTASEVSMTFEVAYTKYNDGSADELRVFASGDCGATWDELYHKTHTDLETAVVAQASSNAWKPTISDDWRLETIDLSAYLGNGNVLVKFENTTGYGTRVWIDNVNIVSKLGIADQVANSFAVYPNPSNGTFTLENNSDVSLDSYKIYSVAGKLVASGIMKNKQEIVTLTGQASGMYVLQIISDSFTFNKKLTVK